MPDPMVRCSHCSVKTLMEQPCRFCVKVQCLKHRTPEDHTCKANLREKITLTQVVASKVDKI